MSWLTRYTPEILEPEGELILTPHNKGEAVLYADHLADRAAAERAAYEKGVNDALKAVPGDADDEAWNDSMDLVRTAIQALLAAPTEEK